MSVVLQGAVELNDDGASLLASAYNLLHGPTCRALTPEQCRFVNVDFLVSFWLVSLHSNMDFQKPDGSSSI